MARSAKVTVSLTVSAVIRNTLVNSAVAQASIGGSIIQDSLTDGVSASEVNRVWFDEARTLASGDSEVIDVFDFAGEDIGAGDGKDGLGLALAVEEIVGIAIVQAAGAGSLEIEPDASNGLDAIGIHTVATGGALKLGGLYFKYSPDTDAFDIIDASNHRIKFTANGGAVTYGVYILARHDDEESSSSQSSSQSSSSSSESSSSSASSQSSTSSSSSSTPSSSSMSSSDSSSVSSSSHSSRSASSSSPPSSSSSSSASSSSHSTG